MTSCDHSTLILLPDKENMLRCRHCHLKIKPDELGESYCPECFEVDGSKRYDFEEIAAAAAEIDRYRCEDCGAIIESK